MKDEHPHFNAEEAEAKGKQASWWQNWHRNLHLPFPPSGLYPMAP